ncbi:MAG: hypothetical protein ABI362_07935 [Chthoniobacterales bacterium]
MKSSSGCVIPSPSRRLPILHLFVCGSVALTAMTLRAASPDDPSCKAVLDATAKMEHTDNHQRITIGQKGQETEEGESIQVGNTSYIKIDNEWHTSPLSPKDSTAQRQENIRNTKVFTCQYERDETVNGEPAAVYKTHQESDEVKADAELWVSKSRGLVLKEVVKHPDDQQSITVLVDYANVQKPAVVK